MNTPKRQASLIAAAIVMLAVATLTCAAAPAVPSYEPPRLKTKLLAVVEGEPEAAISVELDISATGEVSNARIIDGGFGQKRFGAPLLQGLARSGWEPARLNGAAIPIRRYQVRQRVRWPEASFAVSSGYVGHLQRIVKLIADGDFTSAHRAEQDLLAEHVYSRIEYADVHGRLAIAYAAAGKPHNAILAARASIEEELPTWADDSSPVSREVAELHAQLASSHGFFLEALKVRARQAAQGQTAALKEQIEQLGLLIRSQEPWRGRVVLTEAGLWRHQMGRSRFAFSNVKGELATPILRCRGIPLQAFPVVEGREFALAAGTGVDDCHLEIRGTPGATIEIVEFAEGTK